MNCRDIESLILAERDGALTNAQHAALSEHVATCPACRKLSANLTTALSLYQAESAAVTVPDANEAWRDLESRLHRPARPHPLAPVLWFVGPLAAAAVIALAFFVSRPATSTPSGELALTPMYDPSIIAGADFVEAGDPNASVMVFVDKESGWLVVWATDVGTDTSG